MIDAVDRLIAERQAMDRGLPAGLTFAVVGHVVIALACLVLPALLPKPQLIQPQEAFAVILPRGVMGGSDAQQDAGPPPRPAQKPEAPPAPKESKVIKPPHEEKREGLAPPDAKKARTKPEPERATPVGAGGGSSLLPGGARGLTVGPPGVPNGADTGGDWYLAGVQRRIWTIWAQQIKPQTQTPVVVAFTILADGSVTDVRVIQQSGVPLVDFAAQRAVLAAQPFATLPKDYGTDRLSIQAVFTPTP